MSTPYPITSTSGQRMAAYLPPLYETSRVVRSMLQAEGAELDQLRGALDETLDQFFVATASWGLDQWEQELGLPPDPSLTDDQRRSLIVSQLRGYGTATIAVVRQVAEAYEHGTVDVVEDFAAYTVTIRFVDERGVPPNLSGLQAALRALVPAHLAIQWEFTYFTWQDLDAKAWTWDALDQLAILWDNLATYQ